MSESLYESLSGSLKKLQTLRAQVNYFIELVNKGPIAYEVDDGDDTNDKDGNFALDVRRPYLTTVKDCLSNLNHYIVDFEKSISSVQVPSLPLNPGPMTLLAIDPLLDKTVASQTIQTYKWFSKMHDEAVLMMSTLGSNIIKRSLTGSIGALKKAKRINSTGYLVPIANAEAVIQQLIRHFPDLSLTIGKPNGGQCNPLIVEIVVSHVLRLGMALRGVAVENVSVKAYDEVFKNFDSGKFDLISPSKLEVFVKISQHAKCALVYYQSSSASPEYCLKQMIIWLQNYKSLFTAPCIKCNKILYKHLPPTMRDFRTFEPLHVFCTQYT